MPAGVGTNRKLFVLHACSWSCTGGRNWVNSHKQSFHGRWWWLPRKCPVCIRRDSIVWTGALNFDGDNQFRAHVTVCWVVPSMAQIILFQIIPCQLSNNRILPAQHTQLSEFSSEDYRNFGWVKVLSNVLWFHTCGAARSMPHSVLRLQSTAALQCYRESARRGAGLRHMLEHHSCMRLVSSTRRTLERHRTDLSTSFQ